LQLCREVKDRSKAAAVTKKAVVSARPGANVPKNQRPIHNARSGASTRR